MKFLEPCAELDVEAPEFGSAQAAGVGVVDLKQIRLAELDPGVQPVPNCVLLSELPKPESCRKYAPIPAPTYGFKVLVPAGVR